MALGYMKVARGLMVDWIDGKTVTQPTAWYVGLSTANPLDDMSAVAEPTIGTGAYARSTSIGTTPANWTTAPTPANDGATIGANNVTVSFPASSAAWSTGATTLAFFFVSTSTTSVTSANAISRGSVSPATAVNAAGITLSFAASQLALNITPV